MTNRSSEHRTGHANRMPGLEGNSPDPTPTPRSRAVKAIAIAFTALAATGIGTALVADFLREPQQAEAAAIEAETPSVANVQSKEPELAGQEKVGADDLVLVKQARAADAPEEIAWRAEVALRPPKKDDPRWAWDAQTKANSVADIAETGDDPALPDKAPAPAALTAFAESGKSRAAEAADDITAAIPKQEEDARKGRSASVRTHVNMRASPKDEAKVVAVVPARSKVEVLGCKSWCEIRYEGKRGFVYKGFIR